MWKNEYKYAEHAMEAPGAKWERTTQHAQHQLYLKSLLVIYISICPQIRRAIIHHTKFALENITDNHNYIIGIWKTINLY